MLCAYIYYKYSRLSIQITFAIVSQNECLHICGIISSIEHVMNARYMNYGPNAANCATLVQLRQYAKPEEMRFKPGMMRRAILYRCSINLF